MVKHSRNAKKTKPSKTVASQHFIDASSSVRDLTQNSLPFVHTEDVNVAREEERGRRKKKKKTKKKKEEEKE